MGSAAMHVIRPVRAGDIDAVADLADTAGPGMTTLPPDRDIIAKKIERSLESFSGQRSGCDAGYLVVLEDLETSRVVGTAGVYPKVGEACGFYTYRIVDLFHSSRSQGSRYRIRTLVLSNELTGSTEVGTLLMHPPAGGTGLGRQLARARYLFIAQFPHLFGSQVIAEIRGWQDGPGQSPFWKAVGERFFAMPFADADQKSAVDEAWFIGDLMPRHPLYCCLLSPEAQSAIGRPHRDSATAMKMLLDEGFDYEGLVDVFDAGPVLTASVHRIAAVSESHMTE